MVKIGLLIALKRELPEVIPYSKSKYVQTYNIGDYDIGVLLSGIGQKRAEKATERLSSIDYRVGEFQTFDRPVLSKGKVLEGVLGVDLEAYAIVKKAKEYDTPSIIIKSVSDIIPEKKHLIFPTIRLVYRIFKNFKTAKKGLNDFGQNYFNSQTP
jgi:nucleoside phosphorylase